jgi:hypothetical protein
VLALSILASACNLVATATPTLAPTPTPADDLAIYRVALTAPAQNDLALLDRPTRYSLTLTYDPATLTLSGSEEARYFNRQTAPLGEIYFRLFANYPDAGGKITVTRLTVDGVGVTPVLEAQNTALRVPLDKPLAPNASANLRLEFAVSVPRNGKAHYSDFTASDTITTLPTVYPLIPAYDAAGWHIELPPPYGDLVHADVSLYAVTLTVPSNLVVIASGSTTATRDNGNGTTTWQLVGAPMRDFDFNLTRQLRKDSAVVGETTINAWFEPADAEGGKQALQFAQDAFQVYAKRFGAYPYRELDVVETPTTAAGIEYPGVIVINRALYQDRRAQDNLEFTIGHEVAHQWWYGTVGGDQVNDPWVDEALAQYSTLIYFEDRHGSAAGQFILRNVFQSLYNRARNNGRDAAVNQPVSAFDESDYSAIVYDKGPLFYDAIRKKMGDAKFFKFMRTYYERFRYQIAFPEDILKTAEDACACGLQSEYQQWILSPAAK